MSYLSIARDMAVNRANQTGKVQYVTQFMGRFTVKRVPSLGDTIIYMVRPNDVPTLAIFMNPEPALLRYQAS